MVGIPGHLHFCDLSSLHIQLTRDEGSKVSVQVLWPVTSSWSGFCSYWIRVYPCPAFVCVSEGINSVFYKSKMPISSAHMFESSFLFLHWGIPPLKDAIVLIVLNNISSNSMGPEMNSSTIDILWPGPNPGPKGCDRLILQAGLSWSLIPQYFCCRHPSHNHASSLCRPWGHSPTPKGTKDLYYCKAVCTPQWWWRSQ